MASERQQRGQREGAQAGGGARRSFALAPLALHADQQTDAERGGHADQTRVDEVRHGWADLKGMASRYPRPRGRP
jgi:hypothetical protein